MLVNDEVSKHSESEQEKEKLKLNLALRERGRVIRTLFLLKYMDDEGLRKRIDHQLEKIEHAHCFARAVFYANNGRNTFRFQGGTVIYGFM